MNRAQRRASKIAPAFRGSPECCPKCGSRRVAFDPKLSSKGYGPGLATCINCKTLWEPFDPALIWDNSDPVSSFREPCSNCAFRPGSNEQRDREKWKLLIAGLKEGASFYCHKGVPIEPDATHGFAYPTKTITVQLADCDPVSVDVEDRAKLRLCRGYLNALGKWWKAAAP